MISTSNTTQFATLTSTFVKVKLASGLTINTQTSLITGDTKATTITDILFRNKDASNSRNFDVFIGNTTDSAVQISIPASSGNNGTVALASLAALAPSLFDLDLNGNRVMTIESGIQIYVTNLAALTADVIITLKTRGY